MFRSAGLIGAMLVLATTAFGAGDLVLYMRAGAPAHDQPYRPYQPDAGRLSWRPPTGDEEVWCGIWAQCDFDDELTERGSFTVRSVYTHAWLYSVDGTGRIGLDPSGGYDEKLDEKTTVEIKPDDARCHAYRFRLYTAYQVLEKPITIDFTKPYSEDGSAYRFTWKWAAPRNQPIVHSSPGMTSFVWLNPPPKEVLEKSDADSDGLTDWAELHTHFTNPFAADTDDDGIADAAELRRGWDPNNPDSDLDGIDDFEDDRPLEPDFHQVLVNPTFEDQGLRGPVFTGKRILVKGRLRVASDALLRLSECDVVMDRTDDGVLPSLLVEGLLEADRSTFRSRDGRMLYPMTGEGGLRLRACRMSDAQSVAVASVQLEPCRFDYNYSTIILDSSRSLIDDCMFGHLHFGLHIKIQGTSSRNTIRRCTFRHALFSAIEIHDDAKDNLIEECSFARSDHAVVLKSRPGATTVRNCTFTHCNGGIGISSPENVIEGNRFSERAWAHITLGGRAIKNVVRANTIEDAEISVWGDIARENLFENNEFRNIPGKAILLKDGPHENVFRSNTFRAIAGPVIVICAGCNDNVFEENTLIAPAGGPEIEKGATGNVVEANVAKDEAEEPADPR